MADIEDTIKKLEALEKAKLEALKNSEEQKSSLSICPNCNNMKLTTKSTTTCGQPGYVYKCLHCNYSMSTH